MIDNILQASALNMQAVASQHGYQQGTQTRPVASLRETYTRLDGAVTRLDEIVSSTRAIADGLSLQPSADVKGSGSTLSPVPSGLNESMQTLADRIESRLAVLEADLKRISAAHG